MRKVAIYLLITFIWLSGFMTAKCFAEEPATNADIYALLYESKADIPFSTNSVAKHSIPPFVKRGEMRCEGFKEESLTQGGAIVTTCIEIPPSGRYPVIQGVPA